MNSIYKQLDKIDDSKSLNEKWNVKNQQELNKLKESLDKTVTVDDVKKLVKRLKDELPYGFLTVTDKAVRYMSEEMDGVFYATMEDLVKALNNDPEMIEVVEDEPFELIDCFAEQVFIHHAFEIDEFVEKVKRLNVKYFGIEVVDDVDKEFDEASNATRAMFDENYNVKESLKKDVDLNELVELVKQYICSTYSCADLQIDTRDSTLFVEIWTEDGEYDDYDYDAIYDDSPNFTARLDIEKLIKLKDDIDEFETYVEDSIIGYTDDSTEEDFYDRAAKELESYFNCSGAFLEPSTQLGRGRTFLFADDMKFEGSFDFQAGESYIKSNNFEGFLELCKNSFTVVTDECLTEDAETSTAVMRGIDKVIKDTTEILEEASPIMESGFVEYFDKYKHYVETQDIDKVKNSLDEFIKYINIKFIDRINFFKNQL